MSSKDKQKVQSGTKKTATSKSRKSSPKAPNRKRSQQLASKILENITAKDEFLSQKVQDLISHSSMSRAEAEEVARKELSSLVASELGTRSKKTEGAIAKVEQLLLSKSKELQLSNVQKAYQNLQAGVSPEHQVPLVIAKEQSSLAGPSEPIFNDGAFFPPSLKRSSSQPSLSEKQVLALNPPSYVGDESTVAPSSFMRPVVPHVTNVTNNDNSSTNYDNTVNNITNITQAQSNIKTSQGGGGQHAVMPHHVDESASFGVNMISQALRRTTGGGGAPHAFIDGGVGGNNPNVPPLPTPYKVPLQPKKKTKGYDLIGNALDRILDPSIHSVISSQQPNAYRSERVKDPNVVGQAPKRMEMLDSALWKQPIDPSNATEYSWFKMNDSYCEPAKLGTISCFEKYNADPGIVNLTGMLGDPNGVTMDDRFVNNLNPVSFHDRSVQPCGWVDYSKNFLTGYGIG